MNLLALDAGSSVVSATGKVCVSVAQTILPANEQNKNICGDMMNAAAFSFLCSRRFSGNTLFDGICTTSATKFRVVRLPKLRSPRIEEVA